MAEVKAPYELSVSRLIHAPPAVVWTAFVDHATEWFTPRPWTTPEVNYELHPGGCADVVMQSPEGDIHTYRGVVLHVERGRKLVTTGAITAGWIPQADPMNFIRLDLFEPRGEDTLYTAIARHWDEHAMNQHRDMGFETGWGMATQQLTEVAERLASER